MFYLDLSKGRKAYIMKTKSLRKYILPTTLLFFFFHFMMWLLLLYRSEHAIYWESILRILNQWDAGWYTRILNDGYDGVQSVAFYPLFPACLFLIKSILPFSLHPAMIGTLFSTFIFIFFCIFIASLMKTKQDLLPNWLLPKNLFAWLLLVLSPAAYVFQTSHTESFYIFLSFLSILFAYEKKWVWAAIFAGLCALTKHQGVILSICIAFLSISYINNAKDKLKIFLCSGAISGCLYATFLVYQYIVFSNPFSFVAAQSNWHHIESVAEYFKTFFLQNSVQDHSLGAIKHHIYYFIIFVFCFPLWKASKPIFFYCVSCLLILPLQGELINSFRYTSFLFPVFFMMGSYQGKYKKFILPIILVLFVFLNMQTSYNFFILKWAY